ncbi:hypothetical protein ACX40Y_02710 [Sphingomonas sp. RS6]
MYGLLAALIATLGTAAPPPMTVAEFLAKAAALKAQGPLAMMSPDLALLRSEIESASQAYRADLAAAEAGGRRPHSCPPPKGQVKLDGQQLVAEFERIPPGQRRMSVKAGFYAVMKRRYPCR